MNEPVLPLDGIGEILRDFGAKVARDEAAHYRKRSIAKLNAKLDEFNDQEYSAENASWTRALRWVARECL